MSTSNASKWEAAQELAFTNWVNALLAKIGKRVDDIAVDFADGVRFILFLELLTGKKCVRKYNPEPKDKINKIQNLVIGMGFLDDLGVKARGISPENFYDGNKKLIFGFLWTLYRRFRMANIRADGSAPTKQDDRDPSEREAEEQLLKWCSTMSGLSINQFKTGFRDGHAFINLAQKLTDENSAIEELARAAGASDNISRLAAVFDFAEKNLCIPKLLDAEEVASGNADERTMMLYTSLFYTAYEGRQRSSKTEIDDLTTRVKEMAEIEQASISKTMRLEEMLNMYNQELKMERFERLLLEKKVREYESKQLLDGLLKLRDHLEDHQLLLCRLQQQTQELATGKKVMIWRPPQLQADLSKENHEQIELLGKQLEEEKIRIDNIVHVSEVKPITLGKKAGQTLSQHQHQEKEKEIPIPSTTTINNTHLSSSSSSTTSLSQSQDKEQ